MTREEAIKNIRFVLSALDENSQIAEAYRMAIKALEQEPKTGHWIPIQETIGVDKEGNEMSVAVGYKCSDCGEKHESKTLYCPNCGCCMVEPQEGAIRNEMCNNI